MWKQVNNEEIFGDYFYCGDIDTIVAILILLIANVAQAHHYIYLGHQPVNPNNRNRTFSRWYNTQMFYPSKDKMRFWNKGGISSTLLTSAFDLWFDTGGIGDQTFMDYEIKTGTLQSHQYDVSIETKSSPCSGSFLTGCLMFTTYTHNSTGDAYHWYQAKMEIEPYANFDSDDDYVAVIAHELGHAWGLHEQYADLDTFNCQNPNSSEHSIMESFNKTFWGYWYKCDVKEPSEKDIDRVKAIYGFEADNEAQTPSYPYVSIGPFNNALEVQYSFKDMHIADVSVRLRYYYWPGAVGGTPILAGEELLYPDYNSYYSLGNGLTRTVQDRILSQEWDPADWGVPWGKYVSVCTKAWHSPSTLSPTQTCSSHAYYWAPGP